MKINKTRLPQASALAQDQAAEISLRRTPAAEAALRLARAPIAVGELAERIAAEFAPGAAGQAEEMVSQLMACGALVSSVRPPSTAPDGLGWVLDALSAAGDGRQPGREGIAALREAHSRLCGAAPARLGAIAARMGELAGAPAHPVAVDLHAGCHVTISPRVADEAAAAASALARLSPHPHGASGWKDYRARFLDRYGTGTAVPVTDLLNPVTGLGLPAHYTAPPTVGRCARGERLAALAQQAALDGATEVVLDSALIGEISGPGPDEARPVPHMDITVDIRAAGPGAISEGAFTIVVCGAGRTAMAASSRFLHLLAGDERERLTGLYAGLPVITRGALAAQLSFTPRHLRAENVTRVLRMLPYLLSLGEYHGQDDPARIPLGDLAVTASWPEVVVVFDGQDGSAQRKETNADYKATRADGGEALKPILALPAVKAGLDLFGITWVEIRGRRRDRYPRRELPGTRRADLVHGPGLLPAPARRRARARIGAGPEHRPARRQLAGRPR